MASLMEYKCPNCGGKIEFNVASGNLKCPFCGTEYKLEDLKAYEIGVKNRRDESGEYKKFEYANTSERENEKYTRKPTDEEIEELRKSYENMRRNREKL